MTDKERAQKKLRLYKLKEKLVYNRNVQPLEEIIKSIENNFRKLEHYFIITSRSNMEFNINNTTTYPAFLWQQKLVTIYHIFAPILGVIDARYDEYERDINFKLNFINSDRTEIKEIEENKQQLIILREKILADYSKVIDGKEIDIIKSVLNIIPSHSAFYQLSEDMKKTHYNLSLQGEFIVSYMDGYNKSLYFFPHELYEVYEVLFSEFYKKLTKMKEDEQAVKQLVIKSKIDTGNL